MSYKNELQRTIRVNNAGGIESIFMQSCSAIHSSPSFTTRKFQPATIVASILAAQCKLSKMCECPSSVNIPIGQAQLHLLLLQVFNLSHLQLYTRQQAILFAQCRGLPNSNKNSNYFFCVGGVMHTSFIKHWGVTDLFQ